MDNFKSSIKKLFGNKPGNFKGEGRKLGHADNAKANSTTNSSSQSASSSSSSQAFSGTGHRLGSRPADAAPERPQRPAPRPAPTAAPQPRAQPPARGITDTPNNDTNHANITPASNGSGAQDTVISEEMHLAAALLCSAGEDGTAAGTRVLQILSNVQRDPTNAKFCKLRTSNNIIAAVLQAPGAAQLLTEATFVPVEADGEDFLVIHNPVEALPRIRGALQILSQALDGSRSSPPPPAQAATPAKPPPTAPTSTSASDEPSADATPSEDNKPPTIIQPASESLDAAVPAADGLINAADAASAANQPGPRDGPVDVTSPVSQARDAQGPIDLTSPARVVDVVEGKAAAPSAAAPAEIASPADAAETAASAESSSAQVSTDGSGQAASVASKGTLERVEAQTSEDGIAFIRNGADALDASAARPTAASEARGGEGSGRASTLDPPAAQVSEQVQELGVSAEEWRKQQGSKGGAVVVGGMRVDAPRTQELGISKEEWAARAKAEAAAAESSLPPEPFTGRNTQVVLPTAPDTQLPSWFFDRTSADVKRDYLSARKRAEESQVLMTRAMRERQLEKRRRKHVFASIRVRFPEGCMLQGDFHEDEPVCNIAAWVAFALREPLTFSLASPALPGKNKKLGKEGTIKSLQLMPSFLFNFSWDEPTAMGKSVPCLSDEWLEASKQHYDF